jgi:hypothetical protein
MEAFLEYRACKVIEVMVEVKGVGVSFMKSPSSHGLFVFVGLGFGVCDLGFILSKYPGRVTYPSVGRCPNAAVIFCNKGLRLFFVLFFWLLCYLFLITDNTS